MGGISATHIYTPSLTRTADAAGDIVTSIAAGAPWGRALSDAAKGAADGLLYAEVEILSASPSLHRVVVGVVDNTDNLPLNIGGGSERGFLVGPLGGSFLRISGGSPEVSYGVCAATAGIRFLLWIDCATRKVWCDVSDLWSLEKQRLAEPAGGTNERWTVPGTGPLRIAVSPLAGGSAPPTAVRLCSRYSQLMLRGADLMGARPWDARQVTLHFAVNVAHAAVGSDLVCTWWDQSPGVITTEPTASTTITVGSGGACSVSIWTSLDSGGAGILGLAPPGASVTSARGHFMPVTVP